MTIIPSTGPERDMGLLLEPWEEAELDKAGGGGRQRALYIVICISRSLRKDRL